MPERTVRRQVRGLKRMAEILDAAELVIAEVGYSGMTTNQVATRAGLSPGSLYQFFRNKEEILDGLVSRYTDERAEFWAERLSAVTPDVPLEALIGQLVDQSVAFKARSPAYWAVMHGSATGGELAGAADRLQEAVAEQVAAMLLRRAPDLDPARAPLMASMTVAMVSSVMALISTAKPARAAKLVEELKFALVRYLS